MQDKKDVVDKGPGSVGGVRDKILHASAASVPQTALDMEEEIYVFAQREVDCKNEKPPIPALEFAKVKRKDLGLLIEIARREKKNLVVCPPGFKPPKR